MSRGPCGSVHPNDARVGTVRLTLETDRHGRLRWLRDALPDPHLVTASLTNRKSDALYCMDGSSDASATER